MGVRTFDFALTYISRGWRVFPVHSIVNGRCSCGNPQCPSPGKHPKTRNGVKDATTDKAQIVSWWSLSPSPNVAIATGKASGLVVLDVDSAKGGEESLLALIAQNGRLPETLEVLTGGGGRHLYFAYPSGVAYLKCSVGELGPGLDVRADGGYVVAPPSTHVSGGVYEWEASCDPATDDPAELPDWLLTLLTAGQPSGNGHRPQGAGQVPRGGRNNWLTSEAGRMRRAGMDEPTIYAALATLNAQRCNPPLDDVEVRRIAQSVCRYQPGYALTDAGNAEFLADRCADRVCFRHDLRRWFVFTPPVWREDADGEVERLALETLRERQAQASAIQDSDQRRKTLMFLLNSENGYRLRSMLEIAKSTPALAKSGKDFDRHPMLLAVKNGVIDLETVVFREGKPEDYLTQCAGPAYDPQASAPRWLQFLEEVFEGDRELITFIQRAVGYTLTGLTREQVFFFLYGTGRNGKSRFLDTLLALLGDYARYAAFSTFTRQRGGNGHEDDLMALEGARFVASSESKTVGKLAEDTLKNLAGEDPITGSRKHERTRTFKPQFKLWLAANNRPRVDDVTDGFWRKVILIPFEVKFDGTREDRQLGEKLRAELPGILNWAIKGCLAYQREGLRPPKRCLEAVANWRADNDPIHDFLETCQIGKGLEVRASALYQEYETFCATTGRKAISQTLFSPMVEAHGFRRERRRTGIFFIGISA